MGGQPGSIPVETKGRLRPLEAGDGDGVNEGVNGGVNDNGGNEN